MRYLIILLFCIGFVSCNSSIEESKIVFEDNPVIAHRGAWKAKGLPKNSIAALKEAIRLKCTGSEFDVRMTLDHILIVTHDADFGGLNIETSSYEELAKHKLPNGETLPTLRDFILAGMTDNTTTGLVCEIKPSKIEGRSIEMAEKTVAIVKELEADAYMSYYISFGYEIIKHIKKLNPKANVLYLDGSKTPEQLKKDSITGLDYYVSIFKSKPNYISESKKLGLKLNAWTANKQEDIDWLLDHDFDYITTDEPELAFDKVRALSTKTN